MKRPSHLTTHLHFEFVVTNALTVHVMLWNSMKANSWKRQWANWCMLPYRVPYQQQQQQQQPQLSLRLSVVQAIQQIHGVDHLTNEKEFQAVYFTNNFDNLLTNTCIPNHSNKQYV
jgi:hypothetical protein